MPEVEVHRTLVKSPPELWAELSDVEALARHLGEFGEIRITRTDPETAVAWEGEHARGTVEIKASGWGTKVTLTAETPEAEGGTRAGAGTANPSRAGTRARAGRFGARARAETRASRLGARARARAGTRP